MLLDFVAPDERKEITFGTAEKAVTIDISIIPADKGYALRKKLAKRDSDGQYPPEVLAEIVSMFTDECDTEWIVQNVDYGSLDTIASEIIHNALLRRPEKNG